MEQSKIQVKNLFKTFDSLEVLKDLNFTFEPTKSYAITGVSGTGKSTLMHLLSGLDTPSSGEVLFDEHNINKFNLKQRQHFLNKKLGLIFQEPCLIQELTVLDNVMLKGLIANEDREHCKKHASDLLNNVGLADKAQYYPSQLSGGQQQRVAILRAIFNKPEFILADEPTGNLDKDNGANITDLLLEYHKKYKIGLIVSTHDMHVSKKMDIILKLENGKINI